MSFLTGYVTFIDRVNCRLGRLSMYLLFVMMAILFWSSVSKVFLRPSLWTLEMAQFVMVGYYVIGGPYSLQLGSNVRMDLLYGNWNTRQRAWVDAFTICSCSFFWCFYFMAASTAPSIH
jgi:TRAP-type mannitol/chloroaromatic compound transport system permease small subunit